LLQKNYKILTKIDNINRSKRVTFWNSVYMNEEKMKKGGNVKP